MKTKPTMNVVDVQSKVLDVRRFMPRLKQFKKAVARAALAGVRLLVAPDIWHLLLTGSGFGLIVAGIYVLVGTGWALMAGGVACILTGAFVRKGMTGG